MSTKRFTQLFFIAALVLLSASPTLAAPIFQDSGDMDLDGYCRSLGYNGARIDPTQYNVNSWGCLKSDGTQAGMDLYDLCRWQYGGRLPYPEYSEYNDPYSWFCSSEDLGSPAPRPQSGPPTSQPQQQPQIPKVGGGCPGFSHNLNDVVILQDEDDDGRIWLHEEPSFSSRRIQEIPENTRLVSHEVRTCTEGYTWEQVTIEATGVQGWIAQYNEGQQPAPTKAPPTPRPQATLKPDFSGGQESYGSSQPREPNPCTVNVQAHFRPSMGWFVLEIPKWVQEPYEIFYGGKLVPNNDAGVRHDGYAGETDAAVFLGISTRYAFSHPFILVNANWKIKYSC